MSASNYSYWLDDFTTLDLETTESTPTSTPVAGIQNIELMASVSLESLFTGDSIKRETVKQHEFAPTVNIGYSKFNPVVVEQWLGGGGGSTANSMTDTSDPQQYSISGTFDSQGGDATLDITITGITFEEMPLFAASRGEYVQWDLEGTATDVTDFTVTEN